MKRVPTKTRILKAESLEDRLVLSAAAVILADVPFTSAENIVEPEMAFIGTPVSTSSSIQEFYVGTFYDVNKYGLGIDSQLCWAAATANVLAYTNWGYSTASSGEMPDDWLFTDEYEIYDYYIDNFTNLGGHLFYGFPWFTSREYTIQGSAGWSQVSGDGGGLFPGISIPDVRVYLHAETYGETLLLEMSSYLEEGHGVAVAIGWYTSSMPTGRTGGHTVTVWGYLYDADLNPSDPEYYTGLVISNSDDNYTGTKTFSIEWYEEYGMYRITDYGGGRGWIEDFTCIKPVETLTGVSVTGYSGAWDGEAHSPTVSGVDDSGNDEYTIIYNHEDGSFSLEVPSYTDPGTYMVTVVIVKNEFDAIWSAPVHIVITNENAEKPDVPGTVSAASSGQNTHTVSWDAVSDAAGYELAWSSDGGVSWTSLETEETSALVSGLNYGQMIYYRVRALGNGPETLAGDWSEIVSLVVNPTDIDGDGFIGSGDYAIFSAVWFSEEGDENWDPRCDIDGDGFIGPGELSYLFANWFKTAESPDMLYPSPA